MAKTIQKNQSVLTALRSSSSIQGAGEETIRRLYEQGTLRRYEKGESVLHAKKHTDYVCFLISGKVIEYNMTLQGKRKILFVLDDLDFSAYLGPFFLENRAWYAEGYDAPDDTWLDSGYYQFGLIDRNGTILTDSCFRCLGEYGSPFCEGVAAVSLDRKWGYIDETGQLALPLIYDRAYSFDNGLAWVKIGNRCGYIDHEGKEVFFWDWDAE